MAPSGSASQTNGDDAGDTNGPSGDDEYAVAMHRRAPEPVRAAKRVSRFQNPQDRRRTQLECAVTMGVKFRDQDAQVPARFRYRHAIRQGANDLDAALLVAGMTR